MKKLKFCAIVLLSLCCMFGAAACENNPSLKPQDKQQQTLVDEEIERPNDEVPDANGKNDEILDADDRPGDGDIPNDKQHGDGRGGKHRKHHKHGRPETLPQKPTGNFRKKRVPVEPVPIPVPQPAPQPKM